MSFRPRKTYRYDDGSATAAGCAILLLTLGIGALIKALYEIIRYKPGVYQPLAPHVAQEGGIPPKVRQRLWGAAGYCLIGTAAALGMMGSTYAPQRSQGALVLVLTIVGTGATVWYYQRAKNKALRASQIDLTPLSPQSPQTFTLYPQKAAFDPSRSVALINALLKHEPMLVFQVAAGSEDTRWQVVDPHGRTRPQTLIETLKSHTNQALVAHNEPSTPLEQTVYRQHHYFALANEYAAPIALVDWLKNDDPLLTLAQRMSLLRPGEKITYKPGFGASGRPLRRSGGCGSLRHPPAQPSAGGGQEQCRTS